MGGSGILVLNQPGVYLVDENGNVTMLADGEAIGTTKGLLLMGNDGTNARLLKVAEDGTIRIDPTGTTTQPTLIVDEEGDAAVSDTGGVPEVHVSNEENLSVLRKIRDEIRHLRQIMSIATEISMTEESDE
jgi:hypothetical protein